ncbi:MAG: VTT domain-containing protein [Dehalococcoidales bacterium]|nr:VTT domain-containing protein [Dehalococcoidales bacterium]
MTAVNNQPGVEKKGQTGKRVLAFAMVFFTIAITVGLFVFAQRYPDKVKELAGLGYIGVALISLVSSATIILPVPGVLVAFPLVATLNPVLVALAASTGGIFGEISGYTAGFGGHGLTHGSEIHMRAEGWMKRWGSLTIFLFAAVPLVPFDIAGVVAGALRYPLWKFLLVGWLGKSIKFIALVYAFIWGWDFILRYVG